MNDLVLVFRELIREIITEDIALIISVAVIIAAFFLVWLLLRGVRLWYWKVNDRAGALKKIEARLKRVEKHLAMNRYRKKVCSDTGLAKSQKSPIDTAGLEFAETKAANELSLQASELDTGKEGESLERQGDNAEGDGAQESSGSGGAMPENIEQSRGRSGRIYSRKDLELQIRD